MPKERALFWLDGSYNRQQTKVTRTSEDRAMNGVDIELQCYPAGYWGDMNLRRSLTVSGRVTDEGMALTVRFGASPYSSNTVVWSTVIPHPSSEPEQAAQAGAETDRTAVLAEMAELTSTIDLSGADPTSTLETVAATLAAHGLTMADLVAYQATLLAQ